MNLIEKAIAADAFQFTEWRHAALYAQLFVDPDVKLSPKAYPFIWYDYVVAIHLRTPFTRSERFVRWLARRLWWWMPGAAFLRRKAHAILVQHYGNTALLIGDFVMAGLTAFEPGRTTRTLPVPVLLTEADGPLHVRLRGDPARIDVVVFIDGLSASPLEQAS